MQDKNKKSFEIPRPKFPKRAVVTGGMPYGNKELHFGHVGVMLVFADTYARFLRDRIGKENVIFVGEEKINIQTTTDLQEYLMGHSTIYYIVTTEIVILSMGATLLFMWIMLKYVEKLFVNIHNEDTPFTLENVKYIKKSAIFLIAVVLFPDVTGILFEMITKVDMGAELEIVNLLLSLIVYVMAYIFEYGYEIQLDSKGRIYGNENE